MRGRFVFNGNMGSIEALAQRVRPFLFDRTASPRVLIVTAAWGRGEYHEAPVRAALNAVGVPSRWEGGYDRQITNLCAWHRWQEWLAAHPGAAALGRALAEVQENTRAFYVEKTSFHARRIRRACAHLRRLDPRFGLGDLPLSPRDAIRPDAAVDPLGLYRRGLSRELVHDLADLVQNDVRMLATLGEADEGLAVATGLRFDPAWQAARAELAARVLGADVILVPGGDPASLLGALRFFDLGPVFVEALRRGATYIGVSAGCLVACERIIIYDDNAGDPAAREFRLWDRGLGLLGGLQILPHCTDRIHTHDADNLAYLARRFSAHLCAGLNEESFLLVDLADSTATSIGRHDGVVGFGVDGRKRLYGPGERLPVSEIGHAGHAG